MSNNCNSVSINVNQKTAAFLDPNANSNDHYALADELYLKIFSHLSPVDLQKVIHTNSEGRRLGYDLSLWWDTAEKVSLFMEPEKKNQLIQEVADFADDLSYYRFTKKAMESLFPQVLVDSSSLVSHVGVDPVERLVQRARNLLIIFSYIKNEFQIQNLPDELRDMDAETLSIQDLAKNENLVRLWMQENKQELSKVFLMAMTGKHMRGDLPKEIGLLTGLIRINFNLNEIVNLPPEIGLLANMRELTISRNKIKKIPPELFSLPRLHSLSLYKNLIENLPPEIGQLKEIEDINLSSNRLKNFPPEIGQLRTIKRLDLSDNLFVEVLPVIEKLTGLIFLRYNGNEIKEAPLKIGHLSKMIGINSYADPKIYSHYKFER